MPTCQLLKRGDEQRGAGMLERVQLRQASRDTSEQRLLCRSCGSPVTTQAEAIAIAGRHVHHRTNPTGIHFEFGCFAAAPGAEGVGEPTAQFSWFEGYSWIYSLCRTCTTHLGWRFEGAGPSFHGLILMRLVREEPARTR